MTVTDKPLKQRVEEWLDKPLIPFHAQEKTYGILKSRTGLVSRIIVGGIITLTALTIGNAAWTNISKKWQIPHPVYVTARDYAYPKKGKTGIVMNTEARVDVKQNGSSLEIKLIDKDEFLNRDIIPNPNISIAILSLEKPYLYPEKTRGLYVFKKKFVLPEPTSEISFTVDNLKRGEYLFDAFYVEKSGLFRKINKIIEIKKE